MNPASNNHQPRPVAISDLPLASFLLASGFPLKGITGTGPRAEFVFDAPRETLLKFYQGSDSVSARALFNAQRDLLGLARQRL